MRNSTGPRMIVRVCPSELRSDSRCGETESASTAMTATGAGRIRGNLAEHRQEVLAQGCEYRVGRVGDGGGHDDDRVGIGDDGYQLPAIPQRVDRRPAPLFRKIRPQVAVIDPSVRPGRFEDPGFRYDLTALPSAPAQVEQAEPGHVARRQVELAAAFEVSLRVT